MIQSNHSSSALPFVVQVGFVGSRRLFDNPSPNPVVEHQWAEAVVQHIEESLDELPAELQLSSPHFLCGISAIACGADTMFTRACRERDIPQRIFLPQPIGDFLGATGHNGSSDFTTAQRNESEALLTSPHIIQQRVVSQSPDRTDRFRETNAEILRVSDVVVCLLRHDSHGKPGGTDELLRRAQSIGTPVLEIRLALQDGRPVCKNRWHMPPEFISKRLTIPEPLDRLALPAIDKRIPSSEQYCEPLKKLDSGQAKEQQRFFRYAAVLIIAAHLLATLCATAAIVIHGHFPATVAGKHETRIQQNTPESNIDDRAQESSQVREMVYSASLGELIIPGLLGFEMILLLVGFMAHRSLHNSEASRIWANARVVAELARSIRTIHPLHIYLEHLFRLQLPPRFRPLLRTLSVLHLRSTIGNRNDHWQPQRDNYNRERIVEQIKYYTDRLVEDEFRQKVCQGLFTWCSVLAVAATFAKLMLLIVAEANGGDGGTWPQFLGTLAIILPVLAVAGLSWSAALDCEARIETFRDTVAFLERQKRILPQADTAAEFGRLVLETETVLLGEVANWFSRRANTSVT